MPEAAQKTPSLTPRALEGVLCVEIGTVFFVSQDLMMKSMLELYPVWLLIFARAVVSVAILVPVILLLGAPHRLLTPLWRLHLARATLFSVGFSLFYIAFPLMGLAQLSTIFFSAPLITAALAVLWLGETMGPHRIGALVLGFVGVVVALNPAGAGFSWIAVLPLICASSYAVSQIIARRIGERESTLTTGLYTIALAGVLIVPMGWVVNQVIEIGPEFHHVRWEWPAVSRGEAARLGLLGSLGMVGYMLLSRAYQVTSASLVAPFEYSYLPLAGLFAYLLWGEIPPWTTVIGMGLIVTAGLYLAYRELRTTRPLVSAPPTAEAIHVPGNPVAPVFREADPGMHAQGEHREP